MPRVNTALPATTGDCIRFQPQFTSVGQKFETTFDYMAANSVVNPTAAVIGFTASWNALFQAAFLATLATDVEYSGTIVSCVSNPATPTVGNPLPGGPVPGTVAGDSLASVLAAVVSKYTFTKGQHGRGRNYLGPVPEAFVTAATDPNIINAAGIAAYTALLTLLYANPVATGAQVYTLSILTRPIPPINVVAKGQNLGRAMVLRTILGTSRRRREGRGQ